VRQIITLLGVVFVLGALPGPPGPTLGAAADDSFALAVLRRDGVILPFAYYDSRRGGLLESGGRWLNPWPLTGKEFEIPLQLSDIPGGWWPREREVRSWTAWPLQGAKTEIQARAPQAVVAHCQLGLGLRTSYTPVEPPPPEAMQPYPKDGLATSGPVTVERPVLLEPSSPEWKAVAEQVQGEVGALEEGVIKVVSFSLRWSHPASRRERVAAAFVPETIVRVTPRALYFEGVKTYPPLPGLVARGETEVPDRCNILTYAAGWVLLSADGHPKVQASADVTDCNRVGMVYSLPLGLIPRENAVLSVVQVSGWGYERYEVLEVRGDRVKSVFAVPGGWCREGM
jgi:hypothetical protein